LRLLRKGSLLFEANPTEDWPALGGFEGNRGLFTALRAGYPCLRAHSSAALGALRLALLAVLGIIFELFIGKKELLSGSEDKLRPAIDALECSVGIFHGHFPEAGKYARSAMIAKNAPAPYPCLRTAIHNKGPGRNRRSGKTN
jgi:hypothetical protein